MANLSILTVVCAWCDRLIVAGGSRRSHGICRRCSARFFNDASGDACAAPPANECAS